MNKQIIPDQVDVSLTAAQSPCRPNSSEATNVSLADATPSCQTEKKSAQHTLSPQSPPIFSFTNDQ